MTRRVLCWALRKQWSTRQIQLLLHKAYISVGERDIKSITAISDGVIKMMHALKESKGWQVKKENRRSLTEKEVEAKIYE